MNLEAPVFAYYINIQNLPRQRVVELLEELNQTLRSNFSNVTFLVVPSEFTKVECIYNGNESKYRLKKLLESLESLIDNEHDISKIKQYIREIVLDDII